MLNETLVLFRLPGETWGDVAVREAMLEDSDAKVHLKEYIDKAINPAMCAWHLFVAHRFEYLMLGRYTEDLDTVLAQLDNNPRTV